MATPTRTYFHGYVNKEAPTRYSNSLHTRRVELQAKSQRLFDEITRLRDVQNGESAQAAASATAEIQTFDHSEKVLALYARCLQAERLRAFAGARHTNLTAEIKRLEKKIKEFEKQRTDLDGAVGPFCRASKSGGQPPRPWGDFTGDNGAAVTQDLTDIRDQVKAKFADITASRKRLHVVQTQAQQAADRTLVEIDTLLSLKGSE
jgi:hypothetical protein